MNKRRISTITKTGLFVLASLIGLSVPATTMVAAQTASSSGQALEIAPPVMVLKADPGETIETKILLRDISTSNLVVTNEINDFVANGEDGTPKIILEDDEQSAYSMKDWITPLPELTLKSKEIRNLTVTINVPSNASPGGYYSTIRFTGTPPELEGTGVSLSASLGALILLRVNGDAKENLTMEEFFITSGGKSGTFFEAAPLKFAERIKNNGNIHEQPAGQVTITDMFNKRIATLTINQPPNNVLPQSIRKFEQSLDSSVIGKRILFGRYRADVSIIYSDKEPAVTSSITFWVIPYRLISVIVMLLIGGFVALFFLIRRYNRYIINQAHRSRRR